MIEDEVAAMRRLLPCPFCGSGTTLFAENGAMWTGSRMSAPASISVRHWCPRIEGQPSRMLERIGRDLESAIEAWNMRHAPEEAISVGLYLADGPDQTSIASWVAGLCIDDAQALKLLRTHDGSKPIGRVESIEPAEGGCGFTLRWAPIKQEKS